MRYMLRLFDVKEYAFQSLFVYNKIEEGSTIKWGHDENAVDGLREWKVLSCTENRYGI
jgi:hypothetical protein